MPPIELVDFAVDVRAFSPASHPDDGVHQCDRDPPEFPKTSRPRGSASRALIADLDFWRRQAPAG